MIDPSVANQERFFCCLPSKYLADSTFEKKIEKLEDRLIDETLKPFVPSGHAFVCFDSTRSLEACLAKFRMGPCDYAKYVSLYMWEKITSCFSRCSGDAEINRSRTKSTLFRYGEIEDELVLKKYQNAALIMRKATEPGDILWKNMYGRRGLFIVRRLSLFVLGLAIIIFVSSPAVLFSNLRKLDNTHFLDFDWVEKSLPSGGFFKQNIGPMIIICINQILLVLIDYACLFDFTRHTRSINSRFT